MADGTRKPRGDRAQRRVWEESWKELAVIACAPWFVVAHDRIDSAAAWTLPVRVEGPSPFTLVGLWSVTVAGYPTYVRQLDQAADWIERCTDGPVVLAGDFNAPISSSQGHYDTVASRLEALGLVDAYSTSRDLARDQAPEEPTYYHRWRRENPFHIDHVVGPRAWMTDASVRVGDFDTWVGSGRVEEERSRAADRRHPD
ncbi:endonuclease/exonuclease/phosphatase family protein [Modestobacter sp. VKM Ac-2984]|uniref:endonuclease/exonuclease/phosphatase family protein n=1 Tax=Modestobacter sp. VKM Ac-2984 TaxID=3004138 RepID=UPI0022AA54D4|nr:endonuclease/exonuclease/phosphatase family protein [Modestobacter sp. VKM Ac-2984]MCZ2817869.1 hypothetical protein [Modestobacter sp. VKM Ac-2984]